LKEILDDFNYQNPDPKKANKIVIRNAILTALIFDFNDIKIMTIGLLLIIVLVITVRLTVNSIYRIDNSKNSFALAILAGATIFFAEIIYKLFLYLVILKFELISDFIFILLEAIVISLFGVFYGYVRASTIKKENTTIPNLLFFGYFILIALFGKYGML